MTLSLSCDSVSQKRTLSSLLGSRVVKKPKQEDGPRLQEAAIQLLEQQQNLSALLKEVEQNQGGSQGIPSIFSGSLLVCELRSQAAQLGIPVVVLSVKMVLERLIEITGTQDENGDTNGELLTSSQRVQLCALLESSKELLSQGALCPKLLWQEYRRNQRLPKLEVLYHLNSYRILTLTYILQCDEGVRLWLVSQLKALCSWRPLEREEETMTVQQKVLLMVVGVLVGLGFEQSHESTSPNKKISLLCCSVLDDMLFWLLDTTDKCLTLQPTEEGTGLWLQIFDSSLCGVSTSAEALQHFFTHSLTQTLTYKPRLTVSDAITLQNEWTFAKASRLLTSLFRKLAVIFSVELLLRHLQHVLETHEVNWKHVLCFLSTLLVYNPNAQPSLKELLSRLLSSAFEGYDLENMITAFLLARQGALEGPRIFPSYSEWFKMCFSGGSGYHATSKKSLVFLLKFLSDLVPFEPPQYLKVHILHPPFVPVKHRNLLMEYVSLAKTRLADLKESVEDMGLYEDVSAADGAALQPQCQAVQDVEKAVSLFESTGRISATVMEASIFRRPYFLTRFLPALLMPRVLPVKADVRMSFIEALKNVDKIPAAQYLSYVESCQRKRQERSPECLDTFDPVEALKAQLQEFIALVVDGNEGEMSAQMSRISHSLNIIIPGHSDETVEQTVIKVHMGTPDLHVKVVNIILRSFCQCVLDASRRNPPNKQSLWASMFVSVLLGNTQLLSSLIHRLWDLLHSQASLLSNAHLLGMAVFVVHLHVSMSDRLLVELLPSALPEPVPIGEALSLALVCNTRTNMLFCVRFCLAAVCYGICRGESMPQQQQHEYIPSSLYKKLLYLIPRLLPEARRSSITASNEEQNLLGLWSSTTDSNNTWRNSAWYLWQHAAFGQLQHIPQYQLLFSEWLTHELRVQRSEDVLSDPERQEYQQWACLELYLTNPEEQGGCGGDMKILCSHLFSTIMDHMISEQSPKSPDLRLSNTGTCLPDILSRLQELVYEMEVTELSGSRRGRADLSGFLFELVSQRCSTTTSSSTSLCVSSELSLQHTLTVWNRVLLALPAVLFVKVKAEGGQMALDYTKLIEHINQHQRKVCSPPGLLSYHVTAHFLRGVLCASVRCGHPVDEINKAWSQMCLHCPLLVVSTLHWWENLSLVVLSLWNRLHDEESLPKQLQLLNDCQHWASSLGTGLSSSLPLAPPVILAASLYRAWRSRRENNKGFTAALNMLRPDRGTQCRQVLVFLLFFSINDYLSELLYAQERINQRDKNLFTELLSLLVDCGDWLLIFNSNEIGVYHLITMVTTDDFTRLMPWAFYHLLLQQSADLMQRAVHCPGFLHTAVLCYGKVLQLFLEGQTPTITTESSEAQVEPFGILSHAKQFVLRLISQASPTALSSSQLRQLESQCADLDPEVTAALSVHLDPHSFQSPELEFH